MLGFLQDPEKLKLLMMGAGLLSHDPRQPANFGQDLTRGLQGGLLMDQMSAEKQRAKEIAEMRQLQMGQIKSQQEQAAKRQEAIGLLSQQNPQLAPLFNLAPDVAVQRAFPEPQKPRMAFAPDGRAVDMNALKPGESFAKLPDWMNPQYVETQKAIRAAGRPQITTHLPTQEKQEAKDFGALLVSGFKDLQGLAATARKENALLSGLERIPIETGALTPANSTVAAWLKALGAQGPDLERLASGGQTFTALSKDLVLQKQLAQKGPQTESDARRLEQTVASLGNTPQANRVIIAYQKAANKRIIDQERFYADWRVKHKTLDGADRAWFEGKGGMSVWEEPELKRYLKDDEEIDFGQLPRVGG